MDFVLFSSLFPNVVAQIFILKETHSLRILKTSVFQQVNIQLHNSRKILAYFQYSDVN